MYLDDILVYSKDPATHKEDVRSVLERLQNAGLYASLEKYEFSTTSCKFLRYIVSNSGISIDPARIEALVKWPVPKTIKEIQQFLGFTGFYRRFVRNYSKIAYGLTNQLQGRTPPG